MMICDYGTGPAERVSRVETDVVLCKGHAREHYENWRADTSPIGPRTLAQYAPGRVAESKV